MFWPSDTARILLVDEDGNPYSIGTGAEGVFLPSTKFRTVLVDENGIPYKATPGDTSDVVSATQAVAADDTTAVLTHNLGSTSAVLVGAYGQGWNIGSVTILSKTLNTITISFGNQVPTLSPQATSL